jgi:hypothetical protein
VIPGLRLFELPKRLADLALKRWTRRPSSPRTPTGAKRSISTTHSKNSRTCNGLRSFCTIMPASIAERSPPQRVYQRRPFVFISCSRAERCAARSQLRTFRRRLFPMYEDARIRPALATLMANITPPPIPLSPILRRASQPAPTPKTVRRLQPALAAATIIGVVAVATPLLAPGLVESVEMRVAQILQWTPPRVPPPQWNLRQGRAHLATWHAGRVFHLSPRGWSFVYAAGRSFRHTNRAAVGAYVRGHRKGARWNASFDPTRSIRVA